jgi:hypothetical protein
MQGLTLDFPRQKRFFFLYKNSFFFFFIELKNDGFTTPPQQLHNTPSHGVGPSVWSPPPCEGVLCNCCTGEVYESNPYRISSDGTREDKKYNFS